MSALTIIILAIVCGILNRLAGHEFSGKYAWLNRYTRKAYCMIACAAIMSIWHYSQFGIPIICLVIFLISAPLLVLFRAMSGGEKNSVMPHQPEDYTGRNLFNPYVQIADELYIPINTRQEYVYGAIVGVLTAIPLVLMFVMIALYEHSSVIFAIGSLCLLRPLAYAIPGHLYKPSTEIPEFIEFVAFFLIFTWAMTESGESILALMEFVG